MSRRFRQLLAACLLTLCSLYLGGAAWDDCEGGVEEGVQVCHILCVDGCATVPVPDPLLPPSPDELPRLVYEPATAIQLVTFDMEPEKNPPKV